MSIDDRKTHSELNKKMIADVQNFCIFSEKKSFFYVSHIAMSKKYPSSEHKTVFLGEKLHDENTVIINHI